MQKLLLAILGVVLLASHVSAQKMTYDEGVLILTDENFDLALSVFGTVMIDFYAPWCEHCKKLEPDYIKAAKTLHIAKKSVTLAKMDVEKWPKIAERYQIGAYPTLLFVKEQRIYSYQAEPTFEGITSWIEKAISPAYTNITSEEEITTYRANTSVVAVFFGSTEDKAFTKFHAAIKPLITQPQYQHLVINDPEVAKKYSLEGNGEVIIFKQHDTEEVVKEYEEQQLEKMIRTSEFPVVARFDERFAEKIFRNMLPALVMVIGNTPADKEAEKQFLEVKDQLRGDILMAIGHTDDKVGKKLMDFLSLKQADLPAVNL